MRPIDDAFGLGIVAQVVVKNASVVLERGEVVELGSHEELMTERGAYWRLYEAQARNVDTEDEEPPRIHIPLTRVAS